MPDEAHITVNTHIDEQRFVSDNVDEHGFPRTWARTLPEFFPELLALVDEAQRQQVVTWIEVRSCQLAFRLRAAPVSALAFLDTAEPLSDSARHRLVLVGWAPPTAPPESVAARGYDPLISPRSAWWWHGTPADGDVARFGARCAWATVVAADVVAGSRALDRAVLAAYRCSGSTRLPGPGSDHERLDVDAVRTAAGLVAPERGAR